MSINIASICTTQQCVSGNADKVALRIVAADLSKTDYTFNELETLSNRAANALQDVGLTKGDVALIFLPKQIEVFTAFLGILKLQAVAGILFSNFGKEAVFERLLDSSAKVLITKTSLATKLKELLPQLPALACNFTVCAHPSIASFAPWSEAEGKREVQNALNPAITFISPTIPPLPTL